MSPGFAFFIGLAVGMVWMNIVSVYVMTLAIKEERLKQQKRNEKNS